jgi:ubiquinone/menaquinone biosynthesis C-methylase UbiE
MDAKTMWGTGDYAAVAENITAAADAVVERAGIEPALDVLDVACGTGNATIRAARAGGRVTGLDLSPKLLDIARARAAEEGVEIEWVEGDGQALPFEDASFDRVLSTFGHMFVPDHRVAAAELLRVCRPGGRIAFCAWSPTGSMGRMFTAIGQFSAQPPPPEPPILWGTEEHVRELMGDAEFERLEIEWHDESVEEYVRFMEENFGPLIAARQAAGERAVELHDAYVAFLEGETLADDGTLLFRGEYLVSVVNR